MFQRALEITLRQDGDRWLAQVDGSEPFLVGREHRHGINLDGHDNYGPRYETSAEVVQELGQWAFLLYPTSVCESGGFYFCNNTYDAAWFTFGFYQFVVSDEDGGYP